MWTSYFGWWRMGLGGCGGRQHRHHINNNNNSNRPPNIGVGTQQIGNGKPVHRSNGRRGGGRGGSAGSTIRHIARRSVIETAVPRTSLAGGDARGDRCPQRRLAQGNRVAGREGKFGHSRGGGNGVRIGPAGPGAGTRMVCCSVSNKGGRSRSIGSRDVSQAVAENGMPSEEVREFQWYNGRARRASSSRVPRVWDHEEVVLAGAGTAVGGVGERSGHR